MQRWEPTNKALAAQMRRKKNHSRTTKLSDPPEVTKIKEFIDDWKWLWIAIAIIIAALLKSPL